MQSHRPKRGMAHLLELARETGALGVQVAHSGTVAGFLFAPDMETSGLERARAGLAALGLSETWLFSTGVPSVLERAS